MSYRHFIRLSLKQLLLIAAFVAISCAALKVAGTFWWILSAVTLLIFMACALVAAIDRGARQAFALGFVICAAIYGGIVAFVPLASSTGSNNRELDPFAGTLPTSKALSHLYRVLVRQFWHDALTGQPIPNYVPGQYGFGAGGGPVAPIGGDGGMGAPVATTYGDGDAMASSGMPGMPAMASTANGGMGIASFAGGGLGGSMTPYFPTIMETPDRRDFMAVGHLLWMLLLGYIGGHFGSIIYLRRTSNDKMPGERPH